MTNKLAIAIFTLLLTAVAVAQAPAAPAPAAAPAAPKPAAPAATAPAGTKIGIIDIQQAIVATNEGQRDFGALQKRFEPRRTELQSGNTEVENLKKQLNDQGPKLNDEGRANLIKTIELKQKNLQRSFEDAQSEFTAQQNEIANRIGQKVLEVLQKYATENGYALVLDVSSPQSPVLWASQATNITKPIVDVYNAQSNVPAPATPAATAPKPAPKPAPAAAPKKP
jgi:outer membrane protein